MDGERFRADEEVNILARPGVAVGADGKGARQGMGHAGGREPLRGDSHGGQDPFRDDPLEQGQVRSFGPHAMAPDLDLEHLIPLATSARA
jgi:hypothetical protein